MKPILIAAGLAAGLTFNAAGCNFAIAQSESPPAQAGVAAPAQTWPDSLFNRARRPDRGPIEVVVWNIRKSAGHIRVAICTKQTFADAHKTCPYHGDAPAQAGVTTVVVADVPAGTYAAQVFQDEQDLNVIRRGPLGVPLEGVGFSNDAPVPLGPPRFRDASFDHDPAAPLSLRIKLRYFPNL